MDKSSDKVMITRNRKAFHEYFILEKFEAGVVLTGSEVKSLRERKANLKESYATIQRGEVILIGMHIGQYSHTGYSSHDPYRDRKLLLHRQEIRKITKHVTEKGSTLVPLSAYFLRGKVKIEIAIAKGKKFYDKKDSIAKRDQQRAMDKELKNKRMY